VVVLEDKHQTETDTDIDPKTDLDPWEILSSRPRRRHCYQMKLQSTEYNDWIMHALVDIFVSLDLDFCHTPSSVVNSIPGPSTPDSDRRA
jgi:hypothetical protein